MRHDEFIGAVQHRARLSSRGQAEGVTRATLETLGERIPEPQAEHLAAQLPREIAVSLRRTITMGGAGSGERFDLDEFTRRVANRAGVDPPKAVYDARVVLEVLGEATQGETLHRVRDSLPEEMRGLIDAGSSGRMA
ncbi:DUF2267 domain-containing protein [Actinoalloteichus spitiensis]|uniref:DUF2267 domain-containing protein n=1 Tax=Actinoalloteichus spitiensis TaxID=252394 RepID=UPI0003697F66|nr:DUF2267 domain-containing protein [Actinoalloteichus spitiensis]